jgi:2-polyprenyl-3-methyl-5-hydroxy-6-metoxy-1,4-benzoquinol methylase
MRALDRVLQRWRASRARRWLRRGDRVLDIGCHQGEFLRSLRGFIGASVGLDPLARPCEETDLSIRATSFTEPTPWSDGAFDAIVMLATLEHIRDKEPLARECRRLLAPRGRIIVTVPAPLVDGIVAVLTRVRLVDGMSLEEHHGFRPAEVAPIFGRHGLSVRHHARFQCGLNHLFVLEREGSAPA